MIRRFLVSMLFSFVSLAIFILLSIFALTAASGLTESPDKIVIIKPLIFTFSALIGSAPWIFLAYLTAEDSWKEAMQGVYFLPLLLLTISFAPAALFFAAMFVLARIYYRNKYKAFAKEQDARDNIPQSPEV